MEANKLFSLEAKRSVEKIAKLYKPEKIFIFGSFVSGKMNENSDLDFFIIKKTNKSRRERQCEVSRILIDREVPIDIIVFTPAEALKRQKMGDPFILDILESGKLVYDKK
jgi:predicted nucleotidyltransferase